MREKIDTPENLKAQVDSFVEKHRDRIIADTSRILQFQTVSGGSDEEQARYEKDIPGCLRWIESLAGEMGFGFRVLNGSAGEISWPCTKAEAPVFIIASHIDVVTPSGSAQWTHPPFSGSVADGFVWGRGAQDDKGPLIQNLYALWALKELGVKLPCHARIVIGTKEETSNWTDIEDYLRDADAPDYAYTPDADFPIINGEKGLLSVVFEGKWDGPPVDEETGMEFVSLIGGERENIVPSSCELRIRFPSAARTEVMKELVRTTTAFTVENRQANITLVPGEDRDAGEGRCEAVVSFIGKAAHSSLPHQGHNAILDALLFIRDIETFPSGLRQYAAFLYVAASDLRGESLGVSSEHPFIGPATASLSLIEVHQNRARGLINFRHTMGQTFEGVLAKCREKAREFSRVAEIQLEASQKGIAKDPIYLDPEAPRTAGFLKALQKGYHMVTGRPGELRAVGGTTYAKAFPNCCAFGPSINDEEEDLVHQVDERVAVSSILRNVRIYAVSIGLLAVGVDTG